MRILEIMEVLNVVHLFVIFGLFLQVEGYCFGKSPTECVYSGKIIEDGESYETTDDCLTCSCTEGFLSCCSIGGYISDHPDYCKVVKDGPCSEKAVMVNDENKDCDGPIGMVGR